MSDAKTDETPQQPAAEPTRNRPRLGRIATLATCILVLTVLVAVSSLHIFFDVLTESVPSIDHGFLTVGTVGGVVLGVTTLSGWFVFFSGLNRSVRLFTGLVGVILVLAAGASVDFYGNDGNLWSWKAKFRWQKLPDQKLALPEVDEPAEDEADRVNFDNVDSDSYVDGQGGSGGGPGGGGGGRGGRGNAETPDPFPQYLGPNRNGRLPGPAFSNDWDANPPKQLWKQEIGAGWSGFVAANGFAVTMEQRGEQELVTCYEIDTGEVVWFHAEENRHQTPMGGVGPRSTPTIHDGKVYSLGANGILLCLNDADGAVVWRVDLFELLNTNANEQSKLVNWGRAASPMIYEDLVVVPGGGPNENNCVSLMAFDRETGEERWRGGEEQIGYSSPIVASLYGKDHIIIVNESTVTGHRPTDGEELWSWPRPGSSNAMANTSQPLNLGGQSILLTKGYGLGAEVIQLSRDQDKFKVSRLWQNHRLLKTKFTSAVELEGFVYGLSDGILECVRARTGDRMWKDGRYGHGQVMVVGRTLLVLSEKGYVSLLPATPDQFFQWTKFQPLEGVTWNTICLYGNKLLIRNSEMAGCWELPLYERPDPVDDTEVPEVENARPQFLQPNDDDNTDDSNTDDGDTDDSNTDDSNTDDGNTDDGNTDDSNTDDGNTDDSNTDDDDTDDGNTGDDDTGDDDTSR